MACSNCFGGCTDIKSDQCIKYTGVDVPVLGILKGDSLSFVEQALITFLVSTLDGTGIVITFDPAVVICDLVTNNLSECEDLSLTNILTALVKSVCDLQTVIDAVEEDVAVIEADYTIGCLEDVVTSSGTHAILQAVITKLCSLEVDLEVLALDLETNYASIGAELNAQIENYLTEIAPSNLMSNKMIPYVAVLFFDPDLSGKFDGTGKGLASTVWENIYLCNGNNPGVPDLRGRVPVGRTDMGVNAFNAAVDPAISGNPTYASYSSSGANRVTLLAAEMPSHTHIATSVPTVATHTHLTVHQGNTNISLTNTTPVKVDNSSSGSDYTLKGTEGIADIGLTNAATVGITIETTNANTGSSASHSNIQPVLAVNYIIYIPI